MALAAIVFVCLPALAVMLVVKIIRMTALSSHPLETGLMFAFVPAALLGPGLALLRLKRHWFPESYSAKTVSVVVSSLFVTGIFPFALYFCGVWTRPAGFVLFTLLFAALLFGLVKTNVPALARGTFARLRTLGVADLAGLALASAFMTGILLNAFGSPVCGWDALASWDKWGRDMAARDGLGRYVMGGYPQLLPSVYSILYTVFPPPDGGVATQLYALHGLNSAVEALLVPAAFVLCRRLHADFLLCTVFLFGCGIIVDGSFGSGNVDGPTTALLLALFALCADTALCPRRAPVPFKLISFRLIPAAAILCFAKGQGLYFALVAAGAMVFWMPGSWKRRIPAALFVLAGIVITAPYFAHQRIIFASGAAERDMLLHSLPFIAAHTSLFEVSWAKFAGNAEHVALSFIPLRSALKSLPVNVVLIAGGLALCARKRRAAPLLFAGVSGFALWFFTGSYDYRNCMQSLAVLAVCAAAGWSFDFRGWRMARVLAPTALAAMVLGFLGWHAVAGAAKGLPSKSITRPPAEFALPAIGRLEQIWGLNAAVRLRSPVAARARNVFDYDRQTSMLMPRPKFLVGYDLPSKNIWPLDENDLLFYLTWNLNDPVGSVNRFVGGLKAGTIVGTLAEESWLQQIILAKTDYTTVPAAIAPFTDNTGDFAGLPADLTAAGDYLITMDLPQPVPGDMILFNIETSSPSNALFRAQIPRPWMEITPYRGLLGFHYDDNGARGIVWLDGASAESLCKPLPPLAITKRDALPLRIERVSVMILDRDGKSKR